MEVKQNSLLEKDDGELIWEPVESNGQSFFCELPIVGDRAVNALAMGETVMGILLGGVSFTDFLE